MCIRDSFERYGFFDAASVLHTAEIFVPLAELLVESADVPGASPPPLARWRQRLVRRLAAEGSDELLEAWWVPDHRLEGAPLFAAVRAALVTREEIAAALSEGRANAEADEPEASASDGDDDDDDDDNVGAEATGGDAASDATCRKGFAAAALRCVRRPIRAERAAQMLSLIHI